MNMEIGDWEQWHIKLRGDAADLRGEVVLAELLSSSAIQPDQFLYWPNGGFGRAAEQDIERFHPPGALEWSQNKAVVELNRTSLYDLLPEGLFHEVRRTRPFVGVEEIVEEVKHNNAIEGSARLFFLPFDEELMRAHLLVELNERRLTAELIKDRTGKGVKDFWDPPTEFNGDELGKLLMILPYCHKITGDLPAMEKAVGVILGIPVRIAHRFKPHTQETKLATLPMENTHLGVDTVLSGNITSHERVLVVSLGPIHSVLANTFGPSRSGAVKLSKLMEYFTAADQPWELDIHVDHDSGAHGLLLGGVSCSLGVSSILN